MHRLTNNSNLSYKLHVEMEDWNNNRRFAEYEGFRVLGEDRMYQLNIAHYRYGIVILVLIIVLENTIHKIILCCPHEKYI